ncbi:MAG: DUF3189 family protein [Syntrophomonadaceae bacterium]|jgi:hypothetical protein
MKVLFIAPTAVHQALIAGNIFLGRIPDDNLNHINDFGDMRADATGMPLFIGIDKNGTEVYTLGVGSEMDMLKKAIEDLRYILDYTEEDLVVYPIEIKGEPFLSLWAKLLAQLGWDYESPSIVTKALKQRLPELRTTIENFKNQLYN